jgi:hypothetical protein
LMGVEPIILSATRFELALYASSSTTANFATVACTIISC